MEVNDEEIYLDVAPVNSESGQRFINGFKSKIMINAAELRLGNWVLSTFNFKAKTAITLDEVSFPLILKYGGNEFYPIAIVPAILEICGFKELDVVNSDGDDIIGWKIKRPNGDYFYINSDLQPQENGYPIVDYEIEYLHQLQNLFFSLTGEELKVNLLIPYP